MIFRDLLDLLSKEKRKRERIKAVQKKVETVKDSAAHVALEERIE